MDRHCTAMGVSLLLACLGAACYAGRDDFAPGPDEAGAQDEPPRQPPEDDQPQAQCEGGEFDLAPSGMRRLTRQEYDNTIRDLLHDDGQPAAGFDPDASAGPFASNAAINVNDVLVDQYRRAAEELADRADLSALLPCALADDPAGCAERFVEEFGRRAFRRPLEPAEREAYRALYEQGAEPDGPEAGIRLVIQGMLQSPSFLYMVEPLPPGASDGALVVLDDHALASRLSYFLWKTMPDDELLDLADAGALGSSDVLEAQVERMMADPRALDMLDHFHQQWLGTDRLAQAEKRAELYPTFGPALVESMWAETRDFVHHVLTEGDGTLHTLLTASYTVADPSLAELYGVPWPADATGPTRLELPGDQRAGLLTQAAFLARYASSTQSKFMTRGLFVRERLLCQTLPPPDPEVIDNAPDLEDPSLPPRERWKQHLSEPECANCHDTIDPPGFAFEHYDAIGAYRTEIGEWDVDASGELVGTDVNGPFDGAVDLAQRLADSETAHRCLADQWLRFALARELFEQDRCAAQGLGERFLESGGDVRRLLVDIALSDAFRYRRT